MKLLGKAILAALVAVVIGGTIALASGGVSNSPSPSTTATSTSVTSSPTTREDVKGPCDEAEHANEARCDGAQVPGDNNGVEDRNDDRNGIHEQERPDDSGHHSTVGSDDNRGRSGEMEAGDDSGRSDNSGDDSGRSDNSGHGSDDGSSGRNHPEDD
jgi:hypothetical protein